MMTPSRGFKQDGSTWIMPGFSDEILNLIESVSEEFPSYSFFKCVGFLVQNSMKILDGRRFYLTVA